jgi:acyl-coenzyme A synthetase/AMP-(fatty) acid ligase
MQMNSVVPSADSNSLPWLIAASGDPTCDLNRDLFFAKAHGWAQALPARRYMILLCEQRTNFIIAFMAAQVAGQTLLLPSNRSAGAIAEIITTYPDCYCLVDGEIGINAVEVVHCQQLPLHTGAAACPNIDPDHIAAIVFTSGSTGKARPNVKTWGSLVAGARLTQRRFGFTPQHCIVATVPPQHMYGLETTVMAPLVIEARIYGGRPFFPEDVRLALVACEGRRVLVTTPVHLRACVGAGLEWPAIEQIISATAPLDPKLRQQAEQLLNAPVREIYGCTEAGSLASRDGDEWCLYDTFTLARHGDRSVVTAPHLGEAVELADIVEITAPDRFRLLGRQADLINIAGKRASLADLNLKLNAIAGVEDGVFVMADDATRLAALVVAPQLQAAQILAALAEQLDPVFLPRPLYLVDSLPRSETGKLPRQALLNLLHSCGAAK